MSGVNEGIPSAVEDVLAVQLGAQVAQRVKAAVEAAVAGSLERVKVGGRRVRGSTTTLERKVVGITMDGGVHKIRIKSEGREGKFF